MKKFSVCFVFLLQLLAAQEQGFSFYSGPLLFKPLVANTFEPRVGLIRNINENRLRLDIGNSIDLIRYRFDDPEKLLTIGSDFFTYTMLVGEQNFHFPVIAVDYLFGFNVNYKDTLTSGIFSARLRLSHVSAHFVDGHYDNTAAVWKEGMNPRVYSREFFDLAAAFEPTHSFRGYLGALYVYHIDPLSLPKTAFYGGGEYHTTLYGDISGYCAYQLTVSGLRPRHEAQAGIKLGDWCGRGVVFSYLYYAGNNIHGEYHDKKDEYSGISFTINF